MKVKITAQLVASLTVSDSPFEVNDTELRGFHLRVLPSGTKSFYCSYRLRGSRRKNRCLIGRTPPVTVAQARDEATKILGDVARGVDPNQARQERRREQAKPTLRRFIDDHYVAWAEAHLAMSRPTVDRIKAAFSEFLNDRLDALTTRQLDKWKSKRLRSGTKASTVNRDLGALRSALTKAVEWDLLGVHPMSKVKLARVDEDHRVRFLSDQEEIRLRSALKTREEVGRAARESHRRWMIDRGLDPLPSIEAWQFVDHLQVMVLISINTGLRRGELFNLRRSDIDQDQRQLKVRAASAKGGKSRFIALNDEAFSVLDRWLRQHPGEPEGLVFPGKDGQPMTNVKSSWRAVLDAASVSNFRWHDLRHHFASRLVMAGVDLNTVRELLGHADLKMTLRYAHLAPEHKAQAVARLVRVA